MKLNFICLILLIFVCLGGTVFAQNPSQAVFTYKVGDHEVTLLVETIWPGNPSIILADNDIIQRYIPGGNFTIALNAFLVRTPNNTILVDTGLGSNIFNALKSLRVDPADIDTILITHMHFDHISGLVKDGEPAFPNATIYLSKQERGYWTNRRTMANAPEARQDNFRLAQNALATYGRNVKTFSPRGIDKKLRELLPGITPIAAFGHTPGHTMYMVSSGNYRLLIIGDMINVMGIQIPAPDIATVFDIDPIAAAETRKIILQYAAENRIPIAGMHFAYPGIGSLEKQSSGGYRFIPVR